MKVLGMSLNLVRGAAILMMVLFHNNPKYLVASFVLGSGLHFVCGTTSKDGYSSFTHYCLGQLHTTIMIVITAAYLREFSFHLLLALSIQYFSWWLELYNDYYSGALAYKILKPQLSLFTEVLCIIADVKLT